MNGITIDFAHVTGPVKALHGVNNSPATYGEPIDSFREAGIPYVRLHDTMGTYGGTVFVDVPNIFPDFSADENDPATTSLNSPTPTWPASPRRVARSSTAWA